MFPVTNKSRIAHNESYPLKTGEISNLLGDVPQAKVLQIVFWRCWNQANRGSKQLLLVTASYLRRKPSLSTPNYDIENGRLGPKWEIQVAAIDRPLRHRTNTLLITEGVERIKQWLMSNRELDGRFGNARIAIWYDTENDKLLYESE